MLVELGKHIVRRQLRMKKPSLERDNLFYPKDTFLLKPSTVLVY